MRKFPELRFRQIHLDFHTSEHIEDTYRIIGEAYKLVEQREQFAEGLSPVSEIAVVCASTAIGKPDREDAETGACK
ncbi:MAG: hypothetical protein WCP55_05415, partial [Lentisphaerota bacterium]